MLANKKIGEMIPDNLICNTYPQADVKTVQLASGQGVLKRGTVIAFPDATPGTKGVAWTGAAAHFADSIISDDIDTGLTQGGDVTALVYRVGHFSRHALLFGAGVQELSPIGERELHLAGILLSNSVI